MYLIFNIYCLYLILCEAVRKAIFAHLKRSLEARSYANYWFKPEMKLPFL